MGHSCSEEQSHRAEQYMVSPHFAVGLLGSARKRLDEWKLDDKLWTVVESYSEGCVAPPLGQPRVSAVGRQIGK